MSEITHVGESGTEFQRCIVSWCFENPGALKYSDRSDWVFVTYEELQLGPDKMCNLMLEKLELTDLDSMLASTGAPAMNIIMSNQDTLAIMANDNGSDKNQKLVKK